MANLAGLGVAPDYNRGSHRGWLVSGGLDEAQLHIDVDFQGDLWVPGKGYLPH